MNMICKYVIGEIGNYWSPSYCWIELGLFISISLIIGMILLKIITHKTHERGKLKMKPHNPSMSKLKTQNKAFSKAKSEKCI